MIPFIYLKQNTIYSFLTIYVGILYIPTFLLEQREANQTSNCGYQTEQESGIGNGSKKEDQVYVKCFNI